MKRDLPLATDSLVKCSNPPKRQRKASVSSTRAMVPSQTTWTFEATKKELWRLPKDLVKDIIGLYFAVSVQDMKEYELERLKYENGSSLVIHYLEDNRRYRAVFNERTRLWSFLRQDPRTLRRQMRIQTRYISTDENRLVSKGDRPPVNYYESLPEALGPYLFHLAHSKASLLLLC